MIGLIFAAITAAVVYLATRPLLREGNAASPSLEDEAAVAALKAQLSELDRERELGLLNEDEARTTRLEVSRRLLKAAKVKASASDAALTGPLRWRIFAATAVFVAGLSISLYLAFGNPELPDQPLEARLNIPLEQQSFEIQIANVERHLRENPTDARGYSVIAPVYARMGQFGKAAKAYQRAIIYGGETEDRVLGLGEALTFGNNGKITPAARDMFALAVKLNGKSLRGRIWLAVDAEQNGRKAEAEAIYRQLLGENLPKEWREVVQGRLDGLSGEGQKVTSAGGGAGAAGADDGQAQMIRGMVDRLASRLAQNGDDLEGWLRLIKSYTVLNETAKADEALKTAKRQFAANTEAIGKLNALAQSLGLAPAPDGQEARKQ